MTGKYKKIFERVLLGTAVFWVLAFIADILIPWLRHVLRYPDIPVSFGDFGSIITTIAAVICIVTISVTLIVCSVKSKKERQNKATQGEEPQSEEPQSEEPQSEEPQSEESQNGEENEHPE